MSKEEFIQYAALKLLERRNGLSMTEIVSKANELADEIYKERMEDMPKKEPLQIRAGHRYLCIKDYYHQGKKFSSVGDIIIAEKDMVIMDIKSNAEEYFKEFDDCSTSSEKSDSDKSVWNLTPGDVFKLKGSDKPLYRLGEKCDKYGNTYYFSQIMENGVGGGTISEFSLKRYYELVEKAPSLNDIFDSCFTF